MPVKPIVLAPRTATKVVAASDASPEVKARADYVCDGVADDVELKAAHDAVKAAGGGTVFLSMGTFKTNAELDWDGCDLWGSGYGTCIEPQVDMANSIHVVVNLNYYPRLGNFRINGNNHANEFLVDGAYPVIDHIKSVGHKNYNLGLTRGGTVTNCWFYTKPVRITAGGNFMFNSITSGLTEKSMEVNGAHINIIGNSFESFAGRAIDLKIATSYAVNIIGNYFETSAACDYIIDNWSAGVGCSGLSIINNYAGPCPNATNFAGVFAPYYLTIHGNYSTKPIVLGPTRLAGYECRVRAAAGASITFNTLTGLKSVDIINNGRCEIFSNAAPTTGDWLVGDIVTNTAPAAGGPPGWICTTAGTPGTWTKLAPYGWTANKLLKGAGPGADPIEIDVPTTTTITSGSYTGDSTVNRAIPHGLGITPQFVLSINGTDGSYLFHIHKGYGKIWYQSTTAAGYAVTAMDATNFYVGNASSYQMTANYTGALYYWTAIGQTS
jgi:hypothetical protein